MGPGALPRPGDTKARLSADSVESVGPTDTTEDRRGKPDIRGVSEVHGGFGDDSQRRVSSDRLEKFWSPETGRCSTSPVPQSKVGTSQETCFGVNRGSRRGRDPGPGGGVGWGWDRGPLEGRSPGPEEGKEERRGLGRVQCPRHRFAGLPPFLPHDRSKFRGEVYTEQVDTSRVCTVGTLVFGAWSQCVSGVFRREHVLVNTASSRDPSRPTRVKLLRCSQRPLRKEAPRP